MNSSQIKLIQAQSPADYEKIALLAQKIWREHYTSILGAEQVEYMLQQFQTAEKMEQDVEKNRYIYYMMMDMDRIVGYVGVQPDEEGGLYLSKLYIDSDYRGLGLARRALSMLKVYCAANGLDHIWLTVNKHNTNSISAYYRMGFEKECDLVADIGGGFVMDDYKMRMAV